MPPASAAATTLILTRIMVGSSITGMIGLLSFMGNGIIVNDKASRARDIKLEERSSEFKQIVNEKLTDIRLEQRTISVTLKNIEKKI